MRKSYTYRSQALRFRRWSRKAYAAFISVQRAVTIGQLSFSVADRFEKKNQSLHTAIGTFMDGFFKVDKEEKENTGEDKWSLATSYGLFVALFPVLASNEIAHPAHRVAHYTLYNIAKAGSILSNTSRLSYSHPSCRDGACPVSLQTNVYLKLPFRGDETGHAPSLQLGIYT
ncbi:hypothetical protein [uncultured Parabacteroides sp.]|uniref:hypothetical protein n=1 Tax=uncultured Parabacteroides sp. TaxID=512312 RepID=UPI0026297833|nr:hypothetical protein [uncultured Parabacteroides sp.]